MSNHQTASSGRHCHLSGAVNGSGACRRRRGRGIALTALAATVLLAAGHTVSAAADPVERGDSTGHTRSGRNHQPVERGQGAPGGGVRRDGDLVTSAVFNQPGGRQIFDHLEKLIDRTPKDATINVAEFRLQDKQITRSLARAADRGVHVQVVVDHAAVTGQEGTERDNARTLRKKLNATSDEKTWMSVCGGSAAAGAMGGRGALAGSCKGSNAMHSKFFLFSRTSGASAVTAIGTANMNENTVGGTGGWNSFYTDVGSSALHERFASYFRDLARSADSGRPESNYYSDHPPMVTGDVKSYFYPRDKGDTVVNTLRSVRCTSGTKIRIGTWSLSRTAVSRELADLASKGCSVEIVANRIHPAACKELFAGDRTKHLSVKGFSEDSGERGIHTKDMMIEGSYVHKGATAVFTGSMNLNNPSLRDNDEAVVRILDNDRIHAAYLANFSRIQHVADITAKDAKSCERIGS